MSKGFILPTEKVGKTRVNPRRLVLYSKPKAGKTTALSMLDNNLIIDLENGTEYVDALKVNVKSLDELKEVGSAIKEANYPYKYVSIDTTTVLEDLVSGLALSLYKQTPMGKNYAGDNVLKLPQGAGYMYLRQAFFSVLSYIDTFAPHIILVGHLKDKILDDDGTLVQAANIDLTGKIKTMICAQADAIGYLFRKDNQTIISFKSNDEVTCGARPDHLKNQDIVIMESGENGILTSYWDRIYV